MKTKKIRHTLNSKKMKKSVLKVINIIDLVQNENCPKLFQVPLCKL